MENSQCPQSGQFDDRRVYQDFATIDEKDWHETSATKNVNFPAKLHYLLTEMEKEGLQHVASWQTHGRCFFVHDKDLFTQKILPFWFCQSKFDSFQRQLNIYGFARIKSGPDKGGFYHELFLRGKIFLTQGILRKKKNKQRTVRRQASNLDFFTLPSLPSMSSIQTDENAVSASSLISKQEDPPLSRPSPRNVTPLSSVKLHDYGVNNVSAQTRQLDLSLLPLLNSCAMLTDTTACQDSPRVSTWEFSLVGALVQQLKNHHDSYNRTCTSANL